MDIKELGELLIKAKISTYASGGEGGGKILSDGSREFKFKENEFEYIDRYFGFNHFIGEEIVRQNEIVIWGMNYYGGIISEIIPAKDIYQFLQSALKRITEDRPFRGPNNFQKDNLKYINKINGTVEKFEGQEVILCGEQMVYELNYHGGLVSIK